MARKYRFTKKCSYDGCNKRSHEYTFTKKKEYEEALRKRESTQYFCYKHSRSQLCEDNKRLEFTKRYKVVPKWSILKGYERVIVSSDDGRREGASLSGDDWYLDLGDLPLGTTISVETNVSLYIPIEPDAVPEWKLLLKDYRVSRRNHKPVELDELSACLLDGADFVVMVHNGKLLAGKWLGTGTNKNNLAVQGYRHLFSDEKNNIKKMLPFVKKGQRVTVKRWECKDYYCYSHHLAEYSATVISIEDFKVNILTTDGKELQVYLGYVSQETKQVEE